jgi:hypothetical protein
MPPGNVETLTRIIACAVFKPAIEQLQLDKKYPNLRVTFLSSNLHMKPNKLRTDMLRRIARSKRENERVICLYGDCFPDIEAICRWHGAVKVRGHHCYEMLLGMKLFNRIMEQTAGTFFLEKDLITGFEEFCMQPLELYDEEIRRYFFKNYERLLYVRQPSDSDLISKASELARLLELSLEIKDADYSYLKKELTKFL